MKKGRSFRKLIILNYFLEVFILIACLYLFSSKLTILPWYIPLSTYTLLYILILLVFQFILMLYNWFLYEKNTLFKRLLLIGNINTGILLIMFFFCILSIKAFNVSAALVTILDLLLLWYTLFHIKKLCK